MGDSDGVFGGNGSVEWRVKAGRTRKASVKVRRRGNNVPVEDGDQNDNWEATGITEVAVNDDDPFNGSTETLGSEPAGPFFTVTIELPKAGSTERQNFLAALVSAAPKVGPNVAKIRFYLPIVGNHRNQIKVEWPD